MTELVGHMPTKSNPVGPTGARTAATTRRLREAEGLKQSDLGRLLGECGRPMSIDVLSKLEQGARPIDVDDLMALALTLNVAPNLLLLPPTARQDAKVQLAPNAWANEYEAWRWARGEMPLSGGRSDPEKLMANRPDDPAAVFPAPRELADHGPLLQEVFVLLTRLREATGWSFQQIAHVAQVAQLMYAPLDPKKDTAGYLPALDVVEAALRGAATRPAESIAP